MRARSGSIAGLLAGTVVFVNLARPALAHVGGLGGASIGGSIPTWLTILTGGVIVAASFLFTSLLSDHEAIRMVNALGLSVPIPARPRWILSRALGLASVAVLLLVIASGLGGPRKATDNFAILLVWAGWWAGYTMTVYLVGNTWPALNPWRAIARLLPRAREVEYPERFGEWPSVLGLLAMVGIEVVTPVASDPELLAVLVLLYTSVTLAGAALLGVDTWFERVDPVARVFRCYGRVAPIQRTDAGFELRLPTAALAEETDDETDPTTFVIALLWVTTFDGLVSTPAWETLVRFLLGDTAITIVVYLVYGAALLLGYGVFLWLYRTAATRTRDAADTYVTGAYIQRYFAPSLLPIAAGYHVAHFLGYFIDLLPDLLGVVGLAMADVAIPGWFGVLKLGLILLGHVLAVWVAHARSFELFPGVLKPVRSQYPITIAMIGYTMVSMWVVVQPFTAPPFV